jgi:peptide subunit release factor 1 (eRF1)
MITRQQIDHLLGFSDGEHLVTSCYLSLDRSKMPAQMLKIRIKDLLQNTQRQLHAKAGSHKQRESLRRDLEDIEAFVMPEITASRYKAVAIFSCAGEKFWQTFGLPRLVRNLLIAEHNPYIRPLTAILAEYHRFCVVLVDRTRAQIFEVYLGEILQRNDVANEVPRRVREGGFQGRDERHIERRHVNAVHQHFRRVSDELLRLFQRHRFDWFILGGQRDLLREFKQELHPNLRARCGGDFHAEPSRIAGPEILHEALEIEERLEWEHELRIAGELIQKAEAGERAVRGVSATLAALERGEAQTLLVEDGFEMPGYACLRCHFISLEPRDCPHCRQPVEPCADVVDEAIELALERNCQIEHLQGPTPLRDGGRIGALLRYQAA